MRSNKAFEEQVSALERAVSGLRGLDVSRATEDELVELLERLESGARMLAGVISRVAFRLRQLRDLA
ncbi:hypothetical protein DFR70_11994 [Nocardia tenerifensis]|uniref:Uncharacterized protein n=1 Tax=Nocardia tenerifensis TaxID=228006 RepID=A0A318JV84_9NOCA|nr:hypothetical protein [Nocardia tenerifensis]PXX56542.1 hypothetical protein DFR70_11994 [Nocardia tenerifensis]